MPRGRWYLLYGWVGASDSGSFGQVKVEMKASTEEEAIVEAKEMWRTLVAEGAHPAPPFKRKAFLRQPMLVCVISLATMKAPETHFEPLISF